GMEFGPLSKWLLNQPQKRRIPSEALMTRPRQIRRYDIGDPEETFSLSGTGSETASRGGYVHGICSWFRLELEEGIFLDNAPGQGETVFEQMFFPLSDAVKVDEGESLDWSLDCLIGKEGKEAWWKWQVTSGRMTAEGSTFSAFPLTQNRLLRHTEEYVPPPPPNHHVTKRILEIVDEGLTQGEIAARIFSDFPKVFPSRNDALKFVIEVLGEGR
ncbi:MAG: hypothetical protein O2807_14415, partial [bacterium]|nr:hypothetical protein [bacterium]